MLKITVEVTIWKKFFGIPIIFLAVLALEIFFRYITAVICVEIIGKSLKILKNIISASFHSKSVVSKVNWQVNNAENSSRSDNLKKVLGIPTIFLSSSRACNFHQIHYICNMSRHNWKSLKLLKNLI